MCDDTPSVLPVPASAAPNHHSQPHLRCIAMYGRSVGAKIKKLITGFSFVSLNRKSLKLSSSNS